MPVSKCRRRALCSTPRSIQRAVSIVGSSPQRRTQRQVDRQFSSQLPQMPPWWAQHRAVLPRRELTDKRLNNNSPLWIAETSCQLALIKVLHQQARLLCLAKLRLTWAHWTASNLSNRNSRPNGSESTLTLQADRVPLWCATRNEHLQRPVKSKRRKPALRSLSRFLTLLEIWRMTIHYSFRPAMTGRVALSKIFSTRVTRTWSKALIICHSTCIRHQ